MTEILGYLFSVLIGVSLGLIGGGGSILTVPILVYIFGLSAEISTSYSLFIVGLTALFGSFTYYRSGLVNLKAALIFSVPSLVAVFLVRKYLMPSIPSSVFRTGGFIFTKDMLIMSVFSLLMIAASYSMIRNTKIPDSSKMKPGHHYTLIFLEGALVGALTGFLGAGGGFLIIPALVLLAGIPMKEAVGTSLLIIAIKSLLGFTGDISAGVNIDWFFLMILSVFTVSGIYIGSALSKRIHADKLKPAFGWFILVMGIYILIRETLL
ncbi:MAG: hypothetical protein HGGPFJEG_01040 [Ignavibacteria bacterium]|nr:hypothetical protein [Ignavibacteria bacterium]